MKSTTTFLSDLRDRMTHTLIISYAGHVHIFRFTADRIEKVRCLLAWLAMYGAIHWQLAFDKAHEAKELAQQHGVSEMEEFERRIEELRKAGYYTQLYKREQGWSCILFCGRNLAWRPPSGHGETALKALIAADLDRVDVLKQRPVKT